MLTVPHLQPCTLNLERGDVRRHSPGITSYPNAPTRSAAKAEVAPQALTARTKYVKLLVGLASAASDKLVPVTLVHPKGPGAAQSAPGVKYGALFADQIS